MLRHLFLVTVMIFGTSGVTAMADDVDDQVQPLLDLAGAAAEKGEFDDAISTLSKAIKLKPDAAELYESRGSVFAAARRHAQAIADFDSALKLNPNDASVYFRRGLARFESGDVAGSIEDWDRQIALDPKSEKGHWQRGISYYYAGQFRKGQRQFELYQTYDDNDVENVVWRFLCQARVDGADKARASMLSVRLDRRVPMMKIYDLYRGKATVDDVLAAARAGEPGENELHHRLFYAHLYVGLYFEALGNAEKAREHILEADQRPISHYMWDVAHVHAARLRDDKK